MGVVDFYDVKSGLDGSIGSVGKSLNGPFDLTGRELFRCDMFGISSDGRRCYNLVNPTTGLCGRGVTTELESNV